MNQWLSINLSYDLTIVCTRCSFLKRFICIDVLFYVYGYFASMYVCAPCVYLMPVKAKNSVGSPGVRVTDGCEPPSVSPRN